jgi:hypothetical protein
MASEWLDEAREYKSDFDGVGAAALWNVLEVLERRGDGWWYDRVVPSGEEGWALSGQGNSIWIECCKTGLNDPVNTRSQGEHAEPRH